MLKSIFAVGLALLFPLAGSFNEAKAEKPALIAYAPDYFASEWGPGPVLEAGFETQCGCDLILRTGDLAPRLLLEGERSSADVIIGLFDAERAHIRQLTTPHSISPERLFMPFTWEDPQFLPFNWSFLAFVYDEDRLPNPPETFEALANSDLKIALIDPRSSPAGLAMLRWAEAALGEAGAQKFWNDLEDNILTVAPGWSEAYGLFTTEQVPMVLSFTTSPAYHIHAEQDSSIKAAIFNEGHFPYIELAAIHRNTHKPELATEFMEYLVSQEFQNAIFEANWSYPSAIPREKWPPLFAELPWPTKALQPAKDAPSSETMVNMIERWRQALSD